VCVTESLLVTVTVAPGATVALMGENMKLEMVMEVVLVLLDPVATLDVDVDAVEPVPDELEPPPLHAARSSAPARTRTSAPPLYRRAGSRMAQTAWDVGLNASGVPDEVCAPGYIPST
jgi:hypothetical protein